MRNARLSLVFLVFHWFSHASRARYATLVGTVTLYSGILTRLACCHLFVVCLGAQSDTSGVTPGELPLTIQLREDHVRTGDVAILACALKNVSRRSLSFSSMGPQLDYEFEVLDDDRRPVAQRASNKIRAGSTTIRTLAPGQALSDSIEISSLFDLRLEGTYRIRASRRIALSTGQIVAPTSNWVTLTVSNEMPLQSKFKESGRVNLIIALSRELVFPNQPVMLSVTMRNLTSTIVSLKEIDKEADYQISVTDSAGLAVPLTTRGLAIQRHQTVASAGRPVSLDPGGELRTLLDVSEQFNLIAPGVYSITVSRTMLTGDGPENVMSNTVRLTIHN